MNYNLTSCDRCFAHHKRCDKSLSGCFQCKKIKIECTYKREKGKGRAKITLYNQGENSQMRVFYCPPKSTIRKEESIPKQIIYNDKAPIYKYFYLMKCPINIASNFLNISTLNPVQLMSMHHHLLNMKGQKKVIEGNKALNGDSSPNTDKIKNLLFSAEEQYFLLVNPVIPLFLRSYLSFKKRDPLLRFVIWVRGLQLLNITSSTQWLLDQLIPVLIERINLSKIKPNLSSIQILIICYYTARWSKTKSTNVTNYLEIALSMSYQLGLHKKLPKKHKWAYYYIVERTLAFNTLLKLTGFLNLSLNHTIYNTVSEASSNILKEKASKLCHYDQIILQVSFYYHSIYPATQSILKKRATHFVEDNEVKKQIKDIFLIQAQLNGSYSDFFKNTNEIKNKFYSNNQQQEIKGFKRFEGLFFDQIGCLINYLQILHQTFMLFCFKSGYKNNKQIYLVNEIETCSLKILNSALDLGPYQVVSLMIYSFTTSLAQLKSLQKDKLLTCSKDKLEKYDLIIKGILHEKKSLIVHPVLLLYFGLAFGDIKTLDCT